MTHTDTPDAIVVGGGPSGLFAAYEMARLGARVTLLERGYDMVKSLCPKVRAELAHRKLRSAERFRLQCPRCTCLEGLGGAAFHFDTTLGYSVSLTRSKIEEGAQSGSIRTYSGLERALGSFDRASDLIREVYRIAYALGLPMAIEDADGSGQANDRKVEVFPHTDLSPSQQVTVAGAVQLVDALTTAITANGGEVILGAEVGGITRGEDGRWTVEASVAKGEPLRLTTDAVIIGVGKSAFDWTTEMIANAGVEHEPAELADIGVRVETWQKDLHPLVGDCNNPKLAFINPRGESVRTFCVTDGGRLMQYSFAGMPVLEGQHFFDKPTSRTNIGVVTTVRSRDGVNAADAVLEIGRRVSAVAGDKPLVQPVWQLMGLPKPAEEFPTSLIEYTMGDLRSCLPEGIIDDVIHMVELMNEASPGCVPPYAVIAAPVVERVNPSVVLDHDMQTSAPGLYMVGDCSGKLIGITYGAATGLAAARAAMARITTAARA